MSKAHVVLVEDDPVISRVISANLKKRDFEVTSYFDGETAVAEMDTLMSDIILLDITLPGIDGFQVCCHIRQSSNIPIIMISAATGETTRTVALNCGANDFITKPFSMNTFMDRIKANLESYSVVN